MLVHLLWVRTRSMGMNSCGFGVQSLTPLPPSHPFILLHPCSRVRRIHITLLPLRRSEPENQIEAFSPVYKSCPGFVFGFRAEAELKFVPGLQPVSAPAPQTPDRGGEDWLLLSWTWTLRWSPSGSRGKAATSTHPSVSALCRRTTLPLPGATQCWPTSLSLLMQPPILLWRLLPISLILTFIIWQLQSIVFYYYCFKVQK